MNNMRQMLAQAQKLQSKMAEKQKELEKQEVEGSAANGAIVVRITLKGEMKSIKISKDVVNADEVDILEDLVVAAFNDAKSKADKQYESGMKEVTGGFNIPGF
ncbi:MAG: YbaB/EbfC family nucleoid-associated protein [Alphaproteobacteria bacterium]|nr:YbaB/EbfC family nucleoid-associated protein [Alphaproteobacteria bacterium]